MDYKSELAREVTFRLLETSGNFTCTVLKESTNIPVFNSTVSAGTDVRIDTLTPNTTYSIRCTGIDDQCVEVNEMFTTIATGISYSYYQVGTILAKGFDTSRDKEGLGISCRLTIRSSVNKACCYRSFSERNS